MRVAIYARVSKAERDDPTSIPVQVVDCRRRAEEEGWEVVEEYADTGISAWNPRRKRPEFERLLASIEEGRVEAVLVREQERLLRQMRDAVRVQDLAEAGRLRLIAATMESDINFRRARDRDDFRKRASQAQFYSDFLSEKVRATKAQRINDGRYTGGEKEPYGYRRTNGSLEVDPREAEVLHEAVTRLGQGDTVTHICRDWNAAGAHTSRGGRWRPSNLRRTLRGDHLIGGRGYLRILSDEEAAIVRAALDTEKRQPGRPAGLRAPLAGYVFCGECEQKMTSSAGRYYRCTVSHGGCGGTSITMLPLERWALVQSLRHWFETKGAGDEGRRRPDREPDTTPILEELRQLEHRSDRLAEAIADGSMSIREGAAASKRIQARRKELAEQLSRRLPPPQTPPIVEGLADMFTPEELRSVGITNWTLPDESKSFRQSWETRDPEAVGQVRALYSEVLDRVTITRRQQRGREFDPSRVSVTWRADSRE